MIRYHNYRDVRTFKLVIDCKTRIIRGEERPGDEKIFITSSRTAAGVAINVNCQSTFRSLFSPKTPPSLTVHWTVAFLRLCSLPIFRLFLHTLHSCSLSPWTTANLSDSLDGAHLRLFGCFQKNLKSTPLKKTTKNTDWRMIFVAFYIGFCVKLPQLLH